jgi:hypothetical protein
MTQGVKITESFAQRIATTVRRVDAMSTSFGDGKIPTRFEEPITGRRPSRYFRTTEQMPACGSAHGTEVKISSPDCIRVEAVQDAQSVELFDVSNSVRVFNLVKQRGIDLALPVGSIVEAVSESQTSSNDLFWRVLQVLSCDCGSGSSSSGSSSSGSSSSGSSHSGSGCAGRTIDVVTDVQCVNGSIQVTKTPICVAG